MTKIIATFLSLAGWLIYTFRAGSNAEIYNTVGGIICICLIFWLIWFKLEEVD